MAVAKFIPHLRNEHALHRWDVAGEDDVGRTLLGGADLVDHSVGELGAILLRAGREHDPQPEDDDPIATVSSAATPASPTWPACKPSCPDTDLGSERSEHSPCWFAPTTDWRPTIHATTRSMDPVLA